MNILIIGSSGMLGHITTLYLREMGHHVTDISRENRIDEKTFLLDVLNKKSLSKEFLQSFDIIINCAAILLAQSCTDKPNAVLLNSWFPQYLERTLQNTKTKIIQISTDGIFSGKDAPYTEKSIPNTQTFYGKSKLLGELDNRKDLTVRASFVGPDLKEHGIGLFNWFMHQSGNVLGYCRVNFNAVTNLEFAKFVSNVLESDISGIYHLGAAETISKSRFLGDVQKTFDLADIKIVDDDRIQTDNTLLTIRGDIVYKQKTYHEMLTELKEWMLNNKIRYNHYKCFSGGNFKNV